VRTDGHLLGLLDGLKVIGRRVCRTKSRVADRFDGAETGWCAKKPRIPVRVPRLGEPV